MVRALLQPHPALAAQNGSAQHNIVICDAALIARPDLLQKASPRKNPSGETGLMLTCGFLFDRELQGVRFVHWLAGLSLRNNQSLRTGMQSQLPVCICCSLATLLAMSECYHHCGHSSHHFSHMSLKVLLIYCLVESSPSTYCISSYNKAWSSTHPKHAIQSRFSFSKMIACYFSKLEVCNVSANSVYLTIDLVSEFFRLAISDGWPERKRCYGC